MSTLRAQLSDKIPGLDTAKISQTGATSLSTLVSKDKLPVFLAAYNKGLVNVFYCSLAMACVALVASTCLEWRTMRKEPLGAEAETTST